MRKTIEALKNWVDKEKEKRNEDVSSIYTVYFTRATKVYGYSSMALGPSISSHAIALVNLQIYLPYFSDRNGLQYNARKEEEAKDLLKKYKENLVKAKLERNYYNKNTKSAEQQRKLVDDSYAITGGKADYYSVDATAH